MEFILIMIVVGVIAVYALSQPSKDKEKAKSYPVLTNSMVVADGAISTADAKRLYKDFMVEIGFYEKGEAACNCEIFSDEIKERLEDLQIEVNQAKDQLAEAKKEANDFTDMTTEEIIDAKKHMAASLKWEQEELAKAQAALAAFKEDKREFLIEYINKETQG